MRWCYPYLQMYQLFRLRMAKRHICLRRKVSGLSKYAIVWNSFQKEYYGYTQDAPLSELVKRIDLLITNRDDAQNDMRQSREAFKTSATYAMKQLIELANQE